MPKKPAAAAAAPATGAAATIEERLASTETLIAQHKYRHADLLVRAQAGQDVEEEGAKVLQSITKLELQATNMRMFLEARELTIE